MMKTLLIAASTLALVSPALAQSAAAPAITGQANTAQDKTASTPTAAAPAASDMAVSTTQTDASATAAATSAPQDPQSLIATEFPTYDKDGNGVLSKAEFSTWLTTLQEKSSGKPMKPTEAKAFTTASFAKADTDKSKTVTQTELTTYLTAGA